MQAGDQMLYLAFALVPRGVEHTAKVLDCQVRRQEADGRQCQGSVCEPVVDLRPLARRSSRLDPVICGVLGQVQALGAVREE